jgi:hypothetical protein
MSEGVITTMTSLYRAIEPKLWKEDSVRLGKTHGRVSLSDTDHGRLSTMRMSNIVPDEVKLIKLPAFVCHCLQ